MPTALHWRACWVRARARSGVRDAHLAQKAHKAVRIVDHERVVVLGHLVGV